MGGQWSMTNGRFPNVTCCHPKAGGPLALADAGVPVAEKYTIQVKGYTQNKLNTVHKGHSKIDLNSWTRFGIVIKIWVMQRAEIIVKDLQWPQIYLLRCVSFIYQLILILSCASFACLPVTVLGDPLATQCQASLALHGSLPPPQLSPLQDPVSVGVQVYELLLGNQLVLSQAGLLVQHEGEWLVLDLQAHPGKQMLQEGVPENIAWRRFIGDIGCLSQHKALFTLHTKTETATCKLHTIQRKKNTEHYLQDTEQCSPHAHLFLPSHFFHSLIFGWALALWPLWPHCNRREVKVEILNKHIIY